MLVSKLSCPKCKTVLRPAKPLPAGKKVKCPKCANDFTAAEGDTSNLPVAPPIISNAAAAPANKKADKPTAKKIPPKKQLDDEEDSGGVYGIHEADRPKTEEDLENEDEEGGKKKFDFVPDQSIKDLRGPAQAAVIRPSNLLLANGVIGFFGWVILLIIILLPIIFPVLEDKAPGADAAPPPADAKKKQEKKSSIYVIYVWDLGAIAKLPWYFFSLSLMPIFVGIVYACVLTFGAVKMQSLESRTWGMVASGMCMFPYATWGFVTVCSMVLTLTLSILFDPDTILVVLIAFAVLETLACVASGLMSLLTLLRPEVIDGYEYVPDL